MKPYQPPGLWQELAGGGGYVQDHGGGTLPPQPLHLLEANRGAAFMVNFDASTRETCTVREVRTNTPLQALDLMNDVAYRRGGPKAR